MEAAKFRFKKEHEMSEEQQQPQQQQSEPTPMSAGLTTTETSKEPKVIKAEPPKTDPLEGLSMEEVEQWELFTKPQTFPGFYMGVGPSTEFELTSQREIRTKMLAKKLGISPPTQEQIDEIVKKRHKYRVQHGLERATEKDLEEGVFESH
jgi:hypothetical protein